MIPQQPHSAPAIEPENHASLHQGVGRFMASVMGLMGIGLGLTAVVMLVMEMIFRQSLEAQQLLFGTPLRWVLAFGPLAFVWFFSSRISRMSPFAARAAFLSFATLMGLSISWVPLVYSGATMFSAFGVTAVTFAATAAFGYFTKRDMSGLGRFLFMSVIGLIVASVASWVFPALSFWVSAVGVVVFSVYTAYDAQRVRQLYLVDGGSRNLAVFGALSFYINFVNIFLSLLRLFGGRD